MPNPQLSFKKIPDSRAGYELVESKAWQEVVEVGGRICQILGFPRITGQIFGLLFLSAEPLSLDQMSSMLGISKGSASMGTRQLAGWGAIRKVWIPGNRKDYFEAIEDYGYLIRGSYNNLIKARIQSSKVRIANIEYKLQEDIKSGIISSDKKEILEGRIKTLKNISHRIFKLIPIIEKIILR